MDARICLGSASLFYRLEGRQWVGMKQDWLLFKVGTCVGGGGGGGIIRDILLVIMKISIRMVQKFTFFSVLAHKNAMELCVFSNLMNSGNFLSLLGFLYRKSYCLQKTDLLYSAHYLPDSIVGTYIY